MKLGRISVLAISGETIVATPWVDLVDGKAEDELMKLAQGYIASARHHCGTLSMADDETGNMVMIPNFEHKSLYLMVSFKERSE